MGAGLRRRSLLLNFKMMGKSTHYRQYTAECQSIAETLRSGEQRSQLLIIAAEREMLATDAAERANQHADFLMPKLVPANELLGDAA